VHAGRDNSFRVAVRVLSPVTVRQEVPVSVLQSRNAVTPVVRSCASVRDRNMACPVLPVDREVPARRDTAPATALQCRTDPRAGLRGHRVTLVRVRLAFQRRRDLGFSRWREVMAEPGVPGRDQIRAGRGDLAGGAWFALLRCPGEDQVAQGGCVPGCGALAPAARQVGFRRC
jgi:hypothetical protein